MTAASIRREEGRREYPEREIHSAGQSVCAEGGV